MTPIAMTPGFAFRTALEVVRRQEGGYANHASDPGGATNMGITRATLALARGQHQRDVTEADVRTLTWEEAAAIYERLYWREAACDVVASAGPGRARLALAHFDWAVNGGTARARWYLQAALNAAGAEPHLVVDGAVGPKTRAALAQLDDVGELDAVHAYLRLRLAHYRIRAGAAAPADADALSAAGLTRFLPMPSRDAATWLRVWTRRLRAIAVACGLSPEAGAPLA